MLCFPKVSLKQPCTSHLFRIRATFPAYHVVPYFMNRKILSEYYRSLKFSICSFLNSPVTSSPIGTNNLLNTLFSNTLSLSSYLDVRDQVSLSKYNRQNYNFLIFKFLDSKQGDKRLCTEWKQTIPHFNLLLISSSIISNVPFPCV